MKKAVVSILLSVIMLSGILAIGLAVSGWVIVGFKLSRGAVFSAPAYYAAESGIEYVLYNSLDESRRPENAEYLERTGNLSNDAAFEVDVLEDIPFRVKSTGEFMDIKRSIEINWNNTSW